MAFDDRSLNSSKLVDKEDVQGNRIEGDKVI
jgi:hypothetical protein